MTVKQFASIYGVSTRRVQYLIKQGRIPAKLICNRYYIDDSASYPEDKRFTRYWSTPFVRVPLHFK